MKSMFNQFAVSVSKIDRRTIQFVLLVVSLSLFAIGAGAPVGDGGH